MPRSRFIPASTLLEQDGADEADDGGLVGEDVVEPLEYVGTGMRIAVLV
jgi:hypothetical protein